MKLTLIPLLLLITFGCNAQCYDFSRQVFSGTTVTYTSFGQEGVIVIKSFKKSGLISDWTFYKLDKDFNIIDSSVLQTHSNLKVYLKAQTKTSLCILIYNDLSNIASLVIIDFTNFKIKEIPISITVYARFSGMAICGNTLYLGLTMKSTPIVILVNLSDGSMKKDLIPRGKLGYNSVIGLDSDTAARETFIYVGYKTKMRRHGVEMQIWNEFGECIKKIPLAGKQDRNLNIIKCIRISENEYLFSGTFSYTKKNTGEGLFLARYKNGNRDFLRYYHFLDNGTYLHHLHSETQKRVLKKMNKLRHNRKYPDCEYQMIPNTLAFTKDRYFFVGEFYYEDFAKNYNHSAKYGYELYWEYIGNKYSHAGVFSFDHDGEKQYDATIDFILPHFRNKPMSFLPVNIDSANTISLYIPINYSYQYQVNALGKASAIPSPAVPLPGEYGPKQNWQIVNLEPFYEDYMIVVGIRQNDAAALKGKGQLFFIEKIGLKKSSAVPN